MKYEQLKYHAEKCQVDCDELAYKLMKQQEIFGLISLVQSICDFNLFWLYQLSPEVILHESTLTFLSANLKMFKRKLSIYEMLKYDSIIYWLEPANFEEFKNMILKA